MLVEQLLVITGVVVVIVLVKVVVMVVVGVGVLFFVCAGFCVNNLGTYS